jgi:predicted porin
VYGLGENKKTGTNTGGATSTLSIAGRYDNGPVGLLVAYQNEGLLKTVTADTNLKNTLFGAYYDFGVAKVFADYNIAKLEVGAFDAKNKEFAVGASAPVGAFTLRAEYAQSKGDILAVDNKSKGFDLEVLYDLSKRTTLYSSYVSTKHTQLVDSTTSLFAVGVRHKF